MRTRRAGPTRRRRWLLTGAAVACAASAVSLAVAPAGAHADPAPLLGWTAQADGNVVDIVIDNASGLSGIHPVSEIDIPEDSTDFETGPYGHALASVVWPGATAGNFGSLSGELGLPSQLAPLVSKANDTVKAEAFYPAGPQSSRYPSSSALSGVADMKATTNQTGSTATSDLTDASLAGLLQVKGIYGTSNATASTKATATAEGDFGQISLFGGLITIGATTSTATATSDGTTVSGSGTTHLGAITIAGQQVSVGSDGLDVGPASTTLLGPLTSGAEGVVRSIVSALGLTATLLPESVTSKGAVESITSGGLQIGFSLPASGGLALTCPTLPSQLSQLSVLCTLPGLLQGASVTITIGRATATAIATPPFAGGALGSGSGTGSLPPAQTAAAVSPGAGLGSASVPLSGSIGSTSSGAGGGSSTPVASSGATPAPQSSSSPVGLAAIPVSMSTPVKTGTVVGMVLLALLLGAGAIGLGSRLDGPVASDCPHGEDPPLREETP